MVTNLIANPFFLLLILPLLGISAPLMLVFAKEKTISSALSFLSLMMLFGSIGIAAYVWMNNFSIKQFYIFHLPLVHHELDFAFHYDQVSMVFSLLTAFFGFVITQFSKVYLHNEEGYARFFSFLYLLLFGMQLMAIADNLTLFFCGWEMIGLASFFLISFYRTMTTPIQNALKVFIVYRIGDLGFLFADLFWHKLDGKGHLVFSKLHELSTVWLNSSHSFTSIILIIGILLAAAAKSGQIPFYYWVPRAMEGPTPSSAIFYGALAIHAGVLLLMRMMPIWYDISFIKILVALIGIITSFYASLLSRIQSSIKAQLAYASLTQVGIMFFELSLGLSELVLVHIVMHALLRAYQLIVSPSIIVYFLKTDKESLSYGNKIGRHEKSIASRLYNTLYLIALHEGYLNSFKESILSIINFIFTKNFLILLSVIAIGIITLAFSQLSMTFYVCILLALVALWFSGQSFITTNHTQTFNFVLASMICAQTTAYLWSKLELKNFFFSLLLSIFFWFTCRLTLTFLKKISHKAGLALKGAFQISPKIVWILIFFSCGLIGIPPFPNFIIEEIIMSHLADHSLTLPLIVGIAFTINGIAIFQTIANISMGETSLKKISNEVSLLVPLGKKLFNNQIEESDLKQTDLLN